jgi:hypothetical protein
MGYKTALRQLLMVLLQSNTAYDYDSTKINNNSQIGNQVHFGTHDGPEY